MYFSSFPKIAYVFVLLEDGQNWGTLKERVGSVP